ncbi:MAG: hypothetical protein H7Y38_02575 [Armatimonadetes bacterium]|nr:hypothetical protein [Armatimonadota bacterium]
MFHVAAFYKFCPLPADTLPDRRSAVQTFCAERGICGLFLLGTEGVNATVCGSEEAIADFLAYLQSRTEIGTLAVKRGTCDTQAFDRLKVESRAEIVSSGRPDIVPAPNADPSHLSPKQWHELLTGDADYTLIDTRNDFEVGIGAFPGAVNPHTTDFAQFPDWVRESELPKNKPVLMYCTGGIRCEKAALVMREAGYENVYQLDGGILNYLEAYPDGQFDGECFVFDRRVAVDQHLQPTTVYTICPLCGDPGKEAITCKQCGKPGIVCRKCADTAGRRVCSQNCEYHLSLRTNPRQYRHNK